MKTEMMRLGFLAAIALAASNLPTNAAVYCKYVGVPKGCVARAGVVLAPAPVVVAPAARRVVRPRGAVNLGGPVNRVGIR